MASWQIQSGVHYAHSRPAGDVRAWEPLEDHLCSVANKAAELANYFGSAEWGYLAGLWHDMGKYSSRFQRRIRGESIAAEHSSAGAVLAYRRKLAPLSFVIAGHHTGLANREAQAGGHRIPLVSRLRDSAEAFDELTALIPLHLVEAAEPVYPSSVDRITDRDDKMRATDLWIRMLFSALVDADRLETERFYEPEKRRHLAGYDDLETMSRRLDARIDRFPANGVVNEVRAEVLADCRQAADLRPGFFTLTVPTGGGKTLSGMSFALRHAARFGKRRVILAVPYTTIIEQNAKAIGDALGTLNVIEHHSAVDLSTLGRGEERDALVLRRQLATENWDAPIIVTTMVQLFESLFSDHPSRCRKIHNITQSVIMLDEAQSLPPQFLVALLDVMKALVSDYGCSIVLSTATQPSLNSRPGLPWGLPTPTEITRNVDRLRARLSRIQVIWLRVTEVTPYAEIAPMITQHERVLTIVHLRKDARMLAEQLPAEDLYHLSALMCAAHREDTLTEVRLALKEGRPCRTVSTQLVEAGVDVDFPVVFRALAGLDSLAQAAGRCNREGVHTDEQGLPVMGKFIVFRAETQPPAGVLRRGLEETDNLLRQLGTELDFLDPVIMDAYFRGLYQSLQLDPKRVQAERAQLNFETVGSLVQLIEDGFTHPVVIPYGESAAALAEYRRTPTRESARALQRFVVQIRSRDLEILLERGVLETLEEFGYVLFDPDNSIYHRQYGLEISEDGSRLPTLIVG